MFPTKAVHGTTWAGRSLKFQAGALDKLGDDYQKLDTFTGEAGNAVSRHIDDPF